jgi:hypothetical protein
MRTTNLIFLAFLLPAPLALAESYKWVDENGVVSYSQTAPKAIEAETISIKPPTQTSSTDELDRLKQQLQDIREDKELAAQAAKKAKLESEQKAQNCAAARANLANLQTAGNRMLQTSDGSYLRLSEPERQHRLQLARDQIAANCNQ